MTRFVLLEMVFLTAFSLSSDEPVARVLASKFPFSLGLKLVLLGLLLLVSPAFNACKEVTGLHDILASLLMNLQNSAKGDNQPSSLLPSIVELRHLLIHLRLPIRRQSYSILSPNSLAVF